MTADQFRTVLNELPGSKGFDHEVDFLVSAVDANGADADGIIYMDEYMAAIVPWIGFSVVDEDLSGFIEHQELKYLIWISNGVNKHEPSSNAVIRLVRGAYEWSSGSGLKMLRWPSVQ